MVSNSFVPISGKKGVLFLDTRYKKTGDSGVKNVADVDFDHQLL